MWIWRFPEIGVPPNHPFVDGISINQPFWWYPYSNRPPYPHILLVFSNINDPHLGIHSINLQIPKNGWSIMVYQVVPGTRRGGNFEKGTWLIRIHGELERSEFQ